MQCVRVLVVLGILRAKAWLVLPAGGVGVCGRRLTSLEASLWSPASSYTLGSCSSGESLRPGWVGRRRRHHRFPLWGVALKSFGSRLRASWAGRSRHCGRQVPVWQCGCCAASCLWQRWRLRAESGLLMILGSRSLPACSRSRRSGAGSAQAQRFLLQCSSTESKLPGRRRVWLTVWHRPTQASTLPLGGVCAFLCGLPGRPVCLVSTGQL